MPHSLNTKQRRTAAAMTLVVAAMLLIATTGVAGAVDQTNPDRPTAACGGVWHWVHNQTEATSGVLTAQFDIEGQGLVTVTTSNGPPFESTNLHYDIELDTGATLVSASDNVPDGNLLLSHWPVCAPTTSDVTPSTAAETTTSSGVAPSTPEETTTTSEGAVTSTSLEETTTTSEGAVTSTSLEETTTSEGAVTSTSLEETTTTSEGAVTPATAEQTTTSAAESVTPSTRLEVLETTITAPSPTLSATAETLPFTGFGIDETGGIAFSLVALGGLVLLSYGYRPGEGNRYRGRHRRPTRYRLQRVL